MRNVSAWGVLCLALILLGATNLQAQTGACCYPAGFCEITTEAVCNANYGVYHGDGSVCLGDENYNGINDLCDDDVGACCGTDDQCRITTPERCALGNGTFHGYGHPCAGDYDGNGEDDLCDGIAWACCLPDGSCINTNPIRCTQMLGWYGEGESCWGDGDENGVDDWCDASSVLEPKWLQPPDLTTNGADVSACTMEGETPPYTSMVLATDFLCDYPGVITEVKVFGSWYQDVLPNGYEGAVHFRVAIYDDIPDPDGDGPGYSMPGQQLMFEDYIMLSSPAIVHADGLQEGWLDPPNTYTPYPLGDEVVWEYTLPIFFAQTGTPINPKVYWVAVQCVSQDAAAKFGWKTARPPHWNDDAVFGVGDLADGYAPTWDELVWPSNHPNYAGESIDLALSIHGLDDSPRGACCYPDGSCVYQRESDCTGAGGSYMGDWTECQGDVDPQNGIDDGCEEAEFGACCLVDGGCIASTQAGCAGIAGATYSGDGTACLGDGNGDGIDDACQTLGACCYPDGGCALETAANCAQTLGTTYNGDGTTCLGDNNQDGIDDACQSVGACCYGAGGCALMTPSGCSETLGAYMGDGTTCLGDNNSDGVDDACEGLAWGACCFYLGGTLTCVDVFESTCDGLSGLFLGYGTACASNLCDNTPPGSNVNVDAGNGVSVFFEEVSSGGSTAAAVSGSGPPSPSGYTIYPYGSPVYYDISTTAAVTPTIRICIEYDPAELVGDPQDLKIFHWDGSNWVDVTCCVESLNQRVCADVPSLSPFIIAEPSGCCEGRVGDANGLGGDEPTIGDASVMIDAKFITGSCEGILECFTEADVNQSGGTDPTCNDITIGDISTLIDYLFITGASLGLLDCL